MNYKELHAELAQYPHIQQKLDVVWGSKYGRDYIQELLMPERNGRKGFPFDTVVKIQQLLDLHDQTYPQFKPVLGIWDKPYNF